MTSNAMTSEKRGHFQDYYELIDLASPVELISEEQQPSLLDVSLTESVCSDSTMDLESRAAYCRPTPLTNNYVDETNCNSTYESTGCSGPASMEMSSSNVNSNLGKSVSMHDVSNILPLQLTPKSANTVSCETILSQSLSSTTKSKDSGFHRSTSCLSLTSSRRNYDHVPSKVKAYIRNIKESEALWKKNKLAQQRETVIDEPVPSGDESSVLDKEDLIVKIHELQHELCEKAQCIVVQQNMYSELMMQLAQAKTTIDSLRLRQLSWNYSGFNASHNTLSKLNDNNFDLEMYIRDFSVNQKGSDISCNRRDTAQVFEESVKEQSLPTSETPNCSPSEKFRPKKHSTPDKKKNFKLLSPVSKMFSSSSRLDKNFEPLSDLHGGNNSNSLGPGNEKTSANTSCCQCLTTVVTEKYVSKTGSELASGADPINNKLSPVRIDLPNVDPFDKVKKWQASLPNINLVGTHSSSDCDVSEPRRAGKRVDEPRARSDCATNHKQKEVDINCVLSMELMKKCKISDMEDSGPASEQVRNNKNPSKNKLSEHTKDIKPISFKSNNLSNKKSHLEDLTKISPSLSQYRSETSCKKSQKKRLNKRPKIVFESDDSSSSECESHSYLPKSSSHTCTIGNVLKCVSSDNDDSSSVSSSVLGSPTRSPPKRRSPFTQLNGSVKTQKLTSRTNFVLQEPKLNVTVPVKNMSKAKNQRSSFTDGTNCKNSNLNKYLKTESSQRKAWNARNNANFNVCKEFYIKRSSSLQDCHSVMEGMMRDGAVIIGDILHRSHC